MYPQLSKKLPEEITFITTQELEEIYPNLTPKEREKEIAKEKKAVFLIGIGNKLKSGKPHDDRSPDYDDWTLNGDIIVYNPLLDDALELSSMGIRVDAKTLYEQLEKANALNRLEYEFHQKVMDGTLPLTIGGGIGQSRMCMLLLQKAHIGEVQVSLWDDETLDICSSKIKIL